MRRPIVVGTDLSEASDESLLQAEARATRDESPLTVVHASLPLPSVNGQASPDLDRLRGLVRERVKRLTSRPESGFSMVVERGHAHALLARVATAQQALVVVGGHAQDRNGHAQLRDVAERLLPHVAGPLLVTRRRRGSGRVLVAIDLPFRDAGALDAAIREARSAACRLNVMHCIRRSFDDALVAEAMAATGQSARQILGPQPRLTWSYQALRAELARRGIDAELHVTEGDPEKLIPDLAAHLNADLVVLGSSERSPRACRVSLGVLRRLPCTALIAHGAC